METAMHPGSGRKLPPLIACMTMACVLSPPLAAEELDRSKVLDLPFAFYNESFGAAVGYVYGANEYPQPQATVLGAAMAGTRGSYMGFGMLRNYEMPFAPRLFLDAIGQYGYFKDAKTYSDGNPDFVGQRAGSNESHEENYVEGDGTDVFARLNLRYMLPLGDGREQILPKYKLVNGLPLEAAPSSPFADWIAPGRSYIELRPFYRSQEIEGDVVNKRLRTNGTELTFFHDSRDFPSAPSRGSSQRLLVSRDFGALDSSTEWTIASMEADGYISLGETETFRQRVIALDFWTAYSPTWNDSEVKGGQTVFHRPPAYTGATLGGLQRLRAYPASRFNDRSAIYYAGELRLIPNVNPFERWAWLQERAGVQWMQLVGFAELGRVAPDWDFGELHSDMKWSAGAGVRVLAKGIVVRVDAAASSEDFGVQMMIGQPFQF